MDRCFAITTRGKQCKYKAGEGGLCRIHSKLKLTPWDLWKERFVVLGEISEAIEKISKPVKWLGTLVPWAYLALAQILGTPPPQPPPPQGVQQQQSAPKQATPSGLQPDPPYFVTPDSYVRLKLIAGDASWLPSSEGMDYASLARTYGRLSHLNPELQLALDTWMSEEVAEPHRGHLVNVLRRMATSSKPIPPVVIPEQREKKDRPT